MAVYCQWVFGGEPKFVGAENCIPAFCKNCTQVLLSTDLPPQPLDYYLKSCFSPNKSKDRTDNRWLSAVPQSSHSGLFFSLIPVVISFSRKKV